MGKNTIKLLIVDLYGVISKGSYKQVCQWIADKYGYDFDYVYDVVYHKHFTDAAEGRISEQASFERVATELDLEESWQELRKRHLANQELNKPPYEYFKNLEKSGYKVILLSKNTKDQFEDTLDLLDIRDEFTEIINTLYLGFSKGSKETLAYVFEKYKVGPQEAVMIDDQDFNLKNAEEMGVRTIFYKNFKQMEKELEDILYE